ALREGSLEGIDQHRPRSPRFDHVVDVASLCRRVRIREPASVFLDQHGASRFGVGRLLDLLSKDDVDGPLRPHYRDLRSRPGEVEVGANVLRAHDVVGPAVGLPPDHRELPYGPFRIALPHLLPLPYNASPLLP